MPTGYEHLSDEELGVEIARAGGDGPFVLLAEFPEFTAEDAESWGAGCEERSAEEFELEIALRAAAERQAGAGARIGESCRTVVAVENPRKS